MIYILDTNVIRELFNFYFDDDVFEVRETFDDLIESGNIISVKEVYNELDRQCGKTSNLRIFIKDNKDIFIKPESKEEIEVIKKIYSERNFQNNIAQKNILKGRPVADPFLVAKAKSKSCTVVTSENFTTNAAKIPNFCRFLNVRCIKRGEFLREITGRV